MPMRLLVRQAGGAGYLLLFGDVLLFVFRRQRAAGEYSTIDSSALAQMVYIMACFICAGRYFASRENRQAVAILISSPVVFLLFYIVLCMVSALWSPNPTYSAFMAFQSLASLLLVVAALREVSRRCIPQDVIEWAMLWAGWTVVWSVTSDVRGFGAAYMLYPFRSARLSTGVFFFLALYVCKRRFLSCTIVAFAMLSGARKNYWGMLPGLLLGAVLGDRKSKVLAFASVCVLTISMLFFGAEDVIQNTLFRGKAGIGWEYTTGRDQMWTLGWELCMRSPLIGYGFVTGERDMLSEMMGQSAHSMHNMLLSAFMAVGILGPLLLSMYFLGTWMLCLPKAIPPSWRFVFTGTIVMVLVVAMTDPGLGGRVYGSWLSSVVVMTLIAVLCKGCPRAGGVPSSPIMPLRPFEPTLDRYSPLVFTQWT